MARGAVMVVKGEVKLDFFENLKPEHVPPKKRGSGDLALLPDVLHFAVTQAPVWDRVTTPDGEFARVVSPLALN